MLIRVLADSLPDITARLRALCDGYQQSLKASIDSIALPGPVDRTMLRLFLLGDLLSAGSALSSRNRTAVNDDAAPTLGCEL